jgi:hypothetical protein
VELKHGSRYRSQVCETEVIVVRPLPGDVDLTCGGHPLIDIAADPDPGLAIDPGFSTGTLLGKRYTDEGHTFELLCTKAGQGSLSVGDVPLVLSGAKPLPASD